MPFWSSLRRGIALPILALLVVACQTASPPLATQSTTVTLDRGWAAPGETVAADLTGANTREVRVVVAGIEAQVRVVDGSSFEFVVPQGVPTGAQPVEIHLSAQTLLTSLNLLGGDAVPGEFVLIVEPGTTAATLAGLLDPLVFTVLEGPRPLGAAVGPCSGELVRIGVAGVDAGLALDLLKGAEAGGPIWHSDPQSDYDPDTIDHLGAVGATGARLRGLTGAGTVIAVLDTGVSDHGELGSRLLSAEGYDFVDEDADPADAFGTAGHGTPIAVLAAGSLSGVAPRAQVLPVRVCGPDGSCLTSDVTLGLCHALTTAETRLNGMESLVLNLSLGGETPIEAVRAILDYALENGTLVAAAGGNQGREGSPPHYPAAFDMDGVVAVAALQAGMLDELTRDWKPAPFSTRGAYLDVAAPGVDLTSGTPSGGYASGYQGTSFATALASGALALWREASPEMSPADVEAGLEASARALPYAREAVGAGMLDLSRMPR